MAYLAVVVVVVRCTYMSTGTRILPARSRCHVRSWRLLASAAIYCVSWWLRPRPRQPGRTWHRCWWAVCPEEALCCDAPRSHDSRREAVVVETRCSCLREALDLTPFAPQASQKHGQRCQHKCDFTALGPACRTTTLDVDCSGVDWEKHE